MHCNSLHFLSQVAVSTISVSKSESISSISVESVCGPLALGGKVVGGGCHLSGGVRGGHCAVGVGHEGGDTIGPTAIESTISQPWLGLSVSGPLSIAVESTIAIPSIAKAIKASVTVVGIRISGPLSISVESTIAIPTIANAKTVAVKATVSVPGVSLWLGLGVSGPLSIAIAKAVSTIAKAKTVAVKTTVSVPGISLWLGLGISGPLAIAIAKAVSTIAKAKTIAIKATVSVPGISLWLGLGISGPLAIAVESTIAITSISKAIKASVTVVGIGISGPLSISVESTIAIPSIAKAKTVSVPRISLWLGLSISISVTLAQTVSKGSNTVDAKGDGRGSNNRGSSVAEAVSSVQTTKAVTVSQPWLSLGFGLGIALPQVSGQGKAIASVGSVVEGLGGQVVGSSGLDCEGSVWHLGIANGHQLAGGGVGVNGDNSCAVSQPWLGLGSSRGGGDQSSSSKSLHG